MEIEHIIGQSNIPRAVQFIPNTNTNTTDGRYVSAAGGCLVVNSLATPHDQTFLHATDGPLSSLRVSRSGNLIVSGHCGRNADVVVWDAQTLQLRMTFHEHERAVVDCDSTDDDTIIASIGAEKRLCFVDVSNGGLIAHLPLNGHVPDYQGPTASPNCPYSTMLVSGPRVQDQKRRQTNLFHTAVVTPQSVLLLHLDPYQGRVLFAVDPAKMRSQMSNFLKTFSAAQFTPFGDLLALGTESGEMALMNPENGAILQTIKACGLGIRSLTVVSTGDMGSAPPNGGGNNNNDFRYANYGPGSQRSSTFYLGGGDGAVMTVTLPSHQQLNQLTLSCKTSVVEPIATLTVIADENTCGNRNLPPPPLPKVLVQAISGAIYTVDVFDTQQKVPEFDMYNKRLANGNMNVVGGAVGNEFSAAQQRSNTFRSGHSLAMNSTMNNNNNTNANNNFNQSANNNNNTNYSNNNGRFNNTGAFNNTNGNGNQNEPPSSSSSSSNVVKIADASRSPFTAIVAHPIDPTRFYTASADGVLREWDLNNYFCKGMFEADTIHATNAKGAPPTSSAFNFHDRLTPQNHGHNNAGVHNPHNAGLTFTHSTGARNGAGMHTGYNNHANNFNNNVMVGGVPAGAGGFKVGSSNGSQCTMLKIAEALDLLLSVWSDGSVKCHDMTNYRLLWSHGNAHKVPITSLCFTNSLKYFITGGADGEVKMWDTKTRELLGSAMAHQQAVLHIEFFEGSEQYLLTASKDRSVCTWEIAVGFSALRRQTFHQTHVGPLTGCKLAMRSGGYDNQGTAGSGSGMGLTNGGGGGGMMVTSGGSRAGSSASLLRGGTSGGGGGGMGGGNFFYSIGVDRKMHLCDLRNPREPIKVVDYNAMPSTLLMNPNGSNSAPHQVDGMVSVLSRSIDSHPTCFAFTADERFVVTGGSDAVVKIWSTQQLFEPMALAAGHSDVITGIIFTCDQKQIVSCGNDGAIVIWNNYF